MGSQQTGTSLRERNKAATRAALTSAAIRLGSERGWDATSVADIAAAAGASRRTFNNYFSSKEDAIVSLGVLRLAEVRELLARRPNDEPLWSAIRVAFRQVFSAVEALDDEQRRAVADLVRATPALQAAQVGADVEAERDLAAGIATRVGAAAGGLYPSLTAAVINRAVRVSYQHWLGTRPPPPFVEVLDSTLSQLAAGLPPPPPSSAPGGGRAAGGPQPRSDQDVAGHDVGGQVGRGGRAPVRGQVGEEPGHGERVGR